MKNHFTGQINFRMFPDPSQSRINQVVCVKLISLKYMNEVDDG